MALLKPEFKGLSAMILHTEREDDNTFKKRKRKGQTLGGEEVEMEEVLSTKKTKVQPPIPQKVLQHTEKDELGDLPTDAKGDPILPDLHN